MFEITKKGGESWHDVHRRANEFLELLIEKYLSDKVQDCDDKELKQEIADTVLTEEVSNMKISYQEETKEADLDNKELNAFSSSQESKTPKVLMVSHRGYMTELLNVINYKIKKEEFATLGNLGNCSITIVEVSRNKEVGDIQYSYVMKDDISHLSEKKCLK